MRDTTYHLLQYFVRHVSWVLAEGTSRRMREDDGRLAGGEGIFHGLGRDVRKVNHHAQAVHLQDDFLWAKEGILRRHEGTAI